MQEKYYLICIFIITIIILIAVFPKAEFKRNPKIGDIVSNPMLYKGKTVILEGKYGGWNRSLP